MEAIFITDEIVSTPPSKPDLKPTLQGDGFAAFARIIQ